MAAEDDYERWVFDEKLGTERLGPVYARCESSGRIAFNTIMVRDVSGSSTDVHEAIILPSGLAAVSCAVEVAIREATMVRDPATGIVTGRRKISIAHSDELYDGSYGVLEYAMESNAPYVKRHNFDVKNFATALEALESRCADDGGHDACPLAMIFLESCSNPSGQVPDFDVLAEFKQRQLSRRRKNCMPVPLTVIVDNTFLSPVLYSPLADAKSSQVVDVVVESLTKYGSGSHAIAGYLATTIEKMAPYKQWMAVHGMHVNADVVESVIQQLSGLHDRVMVAAKIGTAVAAWLQSERDINMVDAVMHASLPSHSTHRAACQILPKSTLQSSSGEEVDATIGPGTMWFHLRTPTTADLLVEKLQKLSTQRLSLEFRTSFGGKVARIDPYRLVAAPTTQYTSVRAIDGPLTKSIQTATPDSNVVDGTGVWVRLAIGYDQSLEEVQAALSALLNELGKM